MALNFASTIPDCSWLASLAWAKEVFAKQQRLSQRRLNECPAASLTKLLKPYLLTFNDHGEASCLQADRYEFLLYLQIKKRFESGEIFLDNSLRHRHFSDELISMTDKADVLAKMDIPFLHRPIETELDALTTELHTQ